MSYEPTGGFDQMLTYIRMEEMEWLLDKYVPDWRDKLDEAKGALFEKRRKLTDEMLAKRGVNSGTKRNLQTSTPKTGGKISTRQDHRRTNRTRPRNQKVPR